MESIKEIEYGIDTCIANHRTDDPALTNLLLAQIGSAILALTKAVEGLNK